MGISLRKSIFLVFEKIETPVDIVNITKGYMFYFYFYLAEVGVHLGEVETIVTGKNLKTAATRVALAFSEFHFDGTFKMIFIVPA